MRTRNSLKAIKYIIRELNKSEYLVKQKVKNAPVVMESEEKYPFIIVYRDGISTSFTKDGIYQDTISFVVEIYSGDSYSLGLDIAEHVREILEELHVDEDDAYLVDCQLRSANELYANDSYLQVLNFEILSW